MKPHSQQDALTESQAWMANLRELNLPTQGFEELRSGTSSQAVATSNGYVVLRANGSIDPQQALLCYRKQQWCAAQAQLIGVSAIDGVNVIENAHGVFMVQPKAIGQEGQSLIDAVAKQDNGGFKAEILAQQIMNRLGAQAKILHRVELVGFGPLQQQADGSWCGSFKTWPAYLQSRIDSLLVSTKRIDDPIRDVILQQQILTEHDFMQIRQELSDMSALDPKPVLCHLDLRPCNVIINGAELTLIDWGMAGADIGVVAELGAFLSCGVAPTLEQCTALLEGYGIERAEVPEILRQARIFVIENALNCAEACAQSTDETAKNWCRTWLGIAKENLDSIIG